MGLDPYPGDPRCPSNPGNEGRFGPGNDGPSDSRDPSGGSGGARHRKTTRDPGENGGGGGAGKPTQKRDPKFLAALTKYLQALFGVSLTGFDESGPGHNGSFTGTAKNGASLSFTNDSTTFSIANLNHLFLGHDTPRNNESDTTGLTLQGRTWVGFGFPGGSSWNPTRTFSLATSYTANNVVASQFWDNQIHELGHQIAQTLGFEKPGDEVYVLKFRIAWRKSSVNIKSALGIC